MGTGTGNVSVEFQHRRPHVDGEKSLTDVPMRNVQNTGMGERLYFSQESRVPGIIHSTVKYRYGVPVPGMLPIPGSSRAAAVECGILVNLGSILDTV
jgi:hypothetical protein